MGEVHERICGTHQSAPKMKWLLRRGDLLLKCLDSDQAIGEVHEGICDTHQ
jgi:hypothetical protein